MLELVLSIIGQAFRVATEALVLAVASLVIAALAKPKSA